MTKRYFLTVVFLLLCTWATAQVATSTWLSFHEKEIRMKRIGMLTLGSWAVGNMAFSGVAISRSVGSNRYFYQMNVYWNVINLALAGFGYYGAAKADPAAANVLTAIKEYYGLEKTLLLNTGLDVAYVLGGLYLTERAKNAAKRPEMLKGFGQSVMLQGGFLFLFDTVFYLVHHQQEKVLPQLLSGVTFTGTAVAWVIRF